MLDAYLQLAPRRDYQALRWVQTSGEAVPARLLERFAEHFDAEFHSMYGQTETSEVAAWEGRVHGGDGGVPIGRQIGIYRLYVLDEALEPVPVGVPGELCVAGVGGLARGYDTLLSLLPFRSEQIITDIGRRVAGPGHRAGAVVDRSPVGYPPARYVERDLEKVYALMARFNFASVLSADPAGEVLVTHLPLVLDRSGGERGILLGHLDRANPQVPLLAAGRATVVFHGPNAYLSPHALATDPLPTWNSMAVHVRGKARLFSGRQALVRVFERLCEGAEPDPAGYRLRPDDERIDRLIDYVVGLEIVIEELVGRFKLSQDLGDGDRRLAACDMVRAGQVDEQPFLHWMFGVADSGGRNGVCNGAAPAQYATAAPAGLVDSAG